VVFKDAQVLEIGKEAIGGIVTAGKKIIACEETE